MTIKQLWQRLEAWANNNAPELLDELQGPASIVEIKELEKRLHLNLPEVLKESLLIHNGEDDGWPARVFYEYGAYLPVPKIYNLWKKLSSLSKDLERYIDDDEQPSDNRIKTVTFSERWIPVMEQNGDVFWAIDLDPGEAGINGQIIEVDWECDSYRVIADSFNDFLLKYVESLEGGKIDIELEKSVNIKTSKNIETTSLEDYFTDDAELEYQKYLSHLSYVDKSTNAPDLNERDFNDGDEIVLYGSIVPNHETNLHKLNALYIGEITIGGRLDGLKNRKGNDLYHVYSVKLKVNVKKGFLTKTREYSILEYNEIDPK
jgi:cell wall assembly regulator SMI1